MALMLWIGNTMMTLLPSVFEVTFAASGLTWATCAPADVLLEMHLGVTGKAYVLCSEGDG
jgi:hypothetical protein